MSGIPGSLAIEFTASEIDSGQALQIDDDIANRL